MIDGNTSDGNHTFNELYHHRAVLFSVICTQYPYISWKSKKHSDGTMFDGMFIAGIETPNGQATYHYYLEPYWDYFKVKELDQAPEWDGHTSAEAIERLRSLTKNKFFVKEEVEKKLNEYMQFDKETLCSFAVMKDKANVRLKRIIDEMQGVIDAIAEFLGVADKGRYLYGILETGENVILDELKHHLDNGGDKVKLKKCIAELENENAVLRRVLGK